MSGILVIVIVNVINHVREYLDYKNCKFIIKLIDMLVEECSENIERKEMVYNGTLNDYGKILNPFYITIYKADIEIGEKKEINA